MATVTDYQRTKRGRTRRDAPANFWTRRDGAVELGLDSFRVRIVRRDRGDELLAERNITAIEWTDEATLLTGSVTFVKGDVPSPVQAGHLLILEWTPTPAKRWREVWRMRCLGPESDVDEGQVTVELASDLAYLQRSVDDWKFGKSKKHPSGMRADKVIREVARKYGLRIGRMAKMTHRIKKLNMTNASPLSVIVRVLKLERNDTGRWLTIRSSRGKMNVEQVRRHPHMLVLGPAIIDATFKKSLRENFVTAITARITIKGAKGKKGGKKRKLRVKVQSSIGTKTYGYVHRKLDSAPKDVDTREELRRFVRRELRRRSLPRREVTFTHPGIPTVRRWDALTISLPQEGVRELVYVSSVRHEVTAGSYVMDVTCRFTDPFIDEEGERIQKAKCKAAKTKDRKPPSYCDASTTKNRKKPTRARTRSNKVGSRKK